MQFVDIGTGNFTNRGFSRISPSGRDLADWLVNLTLLGQVLPSFASKTAVKQFNKLQSQAYQLAVKLGVILVPVPAVYNPDNIQSYGEWMTRFDSIIGRQSQVFKAANSKNLAGLSRDERALAGKWAAWKKNEGVAPLPITPQPVILLA